MHACEKAYKKIKIKNRKPLETNDNAEECITQ